MPEPDYSGPEYDRYLKDEYGEYSPKGTGLYSDFMPAQRWLMYMLAHAAFQQEVGDPKGDITRLQDEIVALLAWAPVDNEAYNAGQEIVREIENSTDPDEGSDLVRLFDNTYGSGNVQGGGLSQFDIPLIDMDDVDGYSAGVLSHMTGDKPIDVNRAMTPFMSRDYYSPMYRSAFIQGGIEFMDTVMTVGEEVVGGIKETFGDTSGDPDFTPDRGPDTAALFEQASRKAYAPGEHETLQTMTAGMNKAVPLAFDVGATVYLGSGAVRQTGTYAGAFTDMLRYTGWAKGEIGAQMLTNGLNRFSGGLSKMWKYRRPIGAFNLAASGLALGMSYGDAQFGDLQIEDVLTGMPDIDNAIIAAWNKPYMQAPYKDPQTMGTNPNVIQEEGIYQRARNRDPGGISRTWQAQKAAERGVR